MVLDLSKYHGPDDAISPQQRVDSFAGRSGIGSGSDLLQLLIIPRGQELTAQTDAQHPRVGFEQSLPRPLWAARIIAFLIESI